MVESPLGSTDAGLSVIDSCAGADEDCMVTSSAFALATHFFGAMVCLNNAVDALIHASFKIDLEPAGAH